MRVISKQRNSKMCIMCGLDNEYGVKAPFYNMEDGSVMTLFRYRYQHQSYKSVVGKRSVRRVFWRNIFYRY